MKKIKLSIYLLLISTLILYSGCAKEAETDRRTIQKGEKKITVIPDTNYTVGEDVVENIKVHENLKGYGWIGEGSILGIPADENGQIETEGEVCDIRNIPNLEEKIISAENLPYQHINISPDKKHIFYVNEARQKGYILDLEGNIKAEAKGPYAGELGEAVWFDNEGLVMPYKDSGFYSITAGGKEMKIEGVEDEEHISKAVKLGSSIYYSTQIGLDRKMKVYDMSAGEKKLFIEGRVTNFYLSPPNDRFIVETHNINQDKTMLLIADLEGKNKDTVAEGRMIYGTSWSPDGLKFAYVLNSRGEEDEGLFIIDIEKRKRSHISAVYLDLGSDIKWNPSGDKMMISSGEVQDGKWIDNTHVITLK
ncbi:hypothetical protein [Peptoclostridium litorale]|nr:hypothetical protein [Peptoclostridium litorale]